MFGEHFKSKLSAYCLGELLAEEARRVAEHLLHCRDCREEYDEIRFGIEMAGRMTRDQAPAGEWGKLMVAIEATQKERRWKGVLTWPMAAASAMAIVLIGLATWNAARRVSKVDPAGPSWEVSRIEGSPVIGKERISRAGRLAIGERLVTDAGSRAQIDVGEIGTVIVEPNSRVSLVRAREEEHRLSLERGKMEALIWAPPGRFYVDTPSAVAIDLGCSYTLEVDDRGTAILRVTSGWVAFEWKGRESFVPAGAVCVTRPSLGPGVPYFGDAAGEFRSALERFETGEAERRSALGRLLSLARKRDGLTLWHLLSRTEGEERLAVHDRLAQLIGTPKSVTREGIRQGDHAMIDAWWDMLELGDTEWWRLWKGPLPMLSLRFFATQ